MFTVFCLHYTAGLLLVGLMLGLTYFSSMLARGRGIMLAIGVVLAYVVTKSVVKHYWPDITLPDIALTEFSISDSPHDARGL